MKSDSSKRNSRTMLRRSGGRFCSLTRGKKIIERGISSASKHHEQRTTIICRREKETKVLARPKLGCNVPPLQKYRGFVLRQKVQQIGKEAKIQLSRLWHILLA